jgi:hypothetical protein
MIPFLDIFEVFSTLTICGLKSVSRPNPNLEDQGIPFSLGRLL